MVYCWISLRHCSTLYWRLEPGRKIAPFPSARFSCTQIFMAKQQKTVHKKRIGRPPGKRFSETIPARLEPQTMAALDAWAVAHDVSRSEAIRRLVELGLNVKGK
jgi:ribbon-helix-helix CopG family protein